MKRILWKRGMRLTHEVLQAADDSTAEVMGKAFILAAAGRFGLLPAVRPFGLSLNVMNGIVDVESLSCLAVTKDGSLIDVHYDTRYTNNFDTRAVMPENVRAQELILTVNAMPGAWHEANDGFEEPVYTFALIAPDTAVPDNALPIGRLVEDHGWRLDELDFVPPCLFVSSHYKYQDLLQRFADLLAAIDTKARESLKTGNSYAVRTFWPLTQQLRIAVDKECDLMTPMMLLANVQKCVSAFICACDMEDGIELADAKMFRGYVMAPYNYKDAYQRIKVGLDLCVSISDHIAHLAARAPQQPKPEPRPADVPRLSTPLIASKDLMQECDTSETSILIAYDNPSATIYFTTNGNEPSVNATKALRTRTGFKIKFDNGFRAVKGKEPNKTMVIKLMAVIDGVSSAIGASNVILRKSLKFRDAIPV